MRELQDLDVEGKTVLVHANLDVPLEDGKITDDTRLKADIDTYEYLLEQGCKVIICGHVGRPKGKDPELSTKAVAERLHELLYDDVHHIDGITGDKVKQEIQELQAPCVAVLENLRYDDRQKAGDEGFAQELAALADAFVNDDYISAHRASSVNIHLPKLLPSARGLALKREWEYVHNAVENPQRPFLLIIGGAKADKIGVINHLLGTCDQVIVGGVLANTFLKAEGHEIGASKFDERSTEIAGEFLRDAEEKFLLPEDVVVAESFDENADHKVVSVVDVPEGWMILDIGSKTREKYADAIKEAKTVIWGGPIGVFEWDAFAEGTKAVAQAMAETDAYTLVAGGDSGSAIHKLGFADKVTHVSIGGGATLHLIAGDELPAIEALENSI